MGVNDFRLASLDIFAVVENIQQDILSSKKSLAQRKQEATQISKTIKSQEQQKI